MVYEYLLDEVYPPPPSDLKWDAYFVPMVFQSDDSAQYDTILTNTSSRPTSTSTSTLLSIMIPIPDSLDLHHPSSIKIISYPIKCIHHKQIIIYEHKNLIICLLHNFPFGSWLPRHDCRKGLIINMSSSSL